MNHEDLAILFFPSLQVFLQYISNFIWAGCPSCISGKSSGTWWSIFVAILLTSHTRLILFAHISTVVHSVGKRYLSKVVAWCSSCSTNRKYPTHVLLYYWIVKKFFPIPSGVCRTGKLSIRAGGGIRNTIYRLMVRKPKGIFVTKKEWAHKF